MRDQVFISYSHEDGDYLAQLKKHLKPLVRAEQMGLWTDLDIEPGQEWFAEIKSALDRAKVAVLLVTPDFWNSEFIERHEFKPLLELARQGQVTLLWVPVRDSIWKETPLESRQAALDPRKPIAKMVGADRDSAWVEVAERIGWALGAESALGTEPAGSGSKPNAPWNWPRLRLTLALTLGGGSLSILIQLFSSPEIAGHLEKARQRLDIGLYADAAAEYQAVLELVSGHAEARFGKAKADLGRRLATGTDLEVVAPELKTMHGRAPQDADLLVLMGDRCYREKIQEDRDCAWQYYQAALASDPRLPEAHYRYAVLLNEVGQFGEAAIEFHKAHELAPETPHYMLGYGVALMKRQPADYGAASLLLEQIEDSPLARLEAAKARWAVGDIGDAARDQAKAIEWLPNPATSATDRAGWKFGLSDKTRILHLTSAAGKRCYAGLALAASRFLQGDQAASEAAFRQAACPADARDIKAAIAVDLETYAEPRPKLAERSQAFRRRLLDEGG
ncbi:TIR domain-containing protein [Methylomagnum ishizawai]|uniref:TIR domain-containing protein n=1 Tax=Methylomagnum ishizawai TaxID=1760988 RepID=A0A1Y6CXA4_9GAMM|nr:toll/interleukin-1 receptor domain-containing protein [Methylomagnum ishizawai]SMF94906.1 TIR domain-containing protein [Methylomagnum ishizawai]